MSDVALEQMRPSSMARVIACPGSRRLAAIAGPRPSSSYADEGTAAHALIERCLTDGKVPFEFFGEQIEVSGKPYRVNNDMVKATSHYVAFVLQAYRDSAPGVRMLTEHKVYISDISNGGTADCIIVDPGNRRIVIPDYKHGKGVYVSETWNAQFMCYAIGVVETIWPADPRGFDTDVGIELVVGQPRFDGSEPIRSQKITGGELQRWRFSTLRPAIEESKKPDARIKAGDHCMFCPAKDICAAYLTSPTKPHRGFQRQGFTVDAIPGADRFNF